MPSYLHPGVYVEEIPSGSRPIEGVATSTAAFVGFANKGPVGEPNLISKWDDYDKEYGGIINLEKETKGDPMGLSVAAFFQNGGTKAYIVRITEDWENEVASAMHAVKAEGYVDHPQDIGKKAIKFTAINEGKWANEIVVKMSVSEIDNNAHDVHIGKETIDGNGNIDFSSIEVFPEVSLDKTNPQFIKDVIDGVSELVTVDMIEDISTFNMGSDQFLGTSASGDLAGVSLDFSSLSQTRRRMKITIDGGSEETILLDNQVFENLSLLAENIQSIVRAKDPADTGFKDFSCVAVENKLLLTSGSRKSSSSVQVNSSYGIAVRLKLGIDANSYDGSSVSGDLGAAFALNLTDPATYPDAASRTLSGMVDGVSFESLDLTATNFSNLTEISVKISEILGLTCAVDGNTLVLTSGSQRSTSSVVIDPSSGIASILMLGSDNGGKELTGQENHENDLMLGISVGGDLGGTFTLDLSDAAVYPDFESRSLRGSIDETAFGPFDLTNTLVGDLDVIRGKISEISGLTCAVDGNRLVLTSDLRTIASSVVIDSDFGIAPTLKLGVDPTKRGDIELNGRQYHDSNFRTQMTGQEYADSAMPKDRLDGGADGGQPGVEDYEKVYTKFIKYRDINIICLPGQYWAKDGSGNSIIAKAIGHAENMKSRMVIVDPEPGHELDNPKKVKAMELPSQTYGVVYYPWVKVANRFYHAERFPGLPKTVLVPPSGYAAGMWAKIDGRRGVWKAPAGMGTGLLGVSELEYKVEDVDQDSLNPWGVNCLRSMPGAGKVIWGSRTRATKADPEWRYVPVRRTAIMIEQSIYNGIQWAVFEPNDHRLWASLRGNIDGFMNGLFRVGAFQGEKASDAYFVRCGLGDTMVQSEIDAGQVIVVVGFAPLKPAEFVIVRIQQKVNLQ